MKNSATKQKEVEIILDQEIMEFSIGAEAFGIDVNMIREIITEQEVTPAALSHPMVEGLVKPRDLIYTVIDLPSLIKNNKVDKSPKDLFILTDYEGMNIAYRVNAVKGIVKLDQNSIQEIDKSVGGDNQKIVKGIVSYEKRLISILDFDSIIGDIVPIQ